MVIKKGNTVIRRIYKGSQLLTAVYKGSTKIWEPPHANIIVAPSAIPSNGLNASFGYSANVPTTVQCVNCSIGLSDYTDDNFVGTGDYSNTNGISVSANENINSRTVAIYIYEEGTNNILASKSWTQASDLNVTNYAIQCSPTSINVDVSDNYQTVYLTVRSAAVLTSSSGQQTAIFADIALSFTGVSGTPPYVTYKKLAINETNFTQRVELTILATSAGVTNVRLSNNGSSTNVRITALNSGGVTPTPMKTMTINFTEKIEYCFLCSSRITSALNTSNFSSRSVSNNKLTISWIGTTLSVNTTTGGTTTISEGNNFYLYYGAEDPGITSSLRYKIITLKSGSTVTV